MRARVYMGAQAVPFVVASLVYSFLFALTCTVHAPETAEERETERDERNEQQQCKIKEKKQV